MSQAIRFALHTILLLLVAPNLLAAEHLVATFGPLPLRSIPATSGQEAYSLSPEPLEQSQAFARLNGLRVCVNNFFGTSDVPVAVKLFDALDARDALFKKEVTLEPQRGVCMPLSLPSEAAFDGAPSVIVAVTVQGGEPVDCSPVLVSAEQRTTAHGHYYDPKTGLTMTIVRIAPYAVPFCER